MRGQDYCYSKIVDDLNLKIGLGEYSVGMYLPYEKQLASRYDVSLSTVRKALSELEQRGFVKTLNGKGTIVIKPDDTLPSCPAADGTSDSPSGLSRGLEVY